MNYSTLLRRSVDFDEYAELPSVGPLRLLPERARAAADPVDDAAALGPRRDQRLRAPHHQRPAREHAREADADAGRGRRPPGREHHGRGRGAHDRRQHLQAGRRPGRHWESNPFMQIPGIDFGPAPFTPFTGSALVYYDGGPVSYFNDGVGEAVIECTNNPALDRCRCRTPARAPACRRTTRCRRGRRPASARTPTAIRAARWTASSTSSTSSTRGRLHPAVHGPGPGACGPATQTAGPGPKPDRSRGVAGRAILGHPCRPLVSCPEWRSLGPGAAQRLGRCWRCAW